MAKWRDKAVIFPPGNPPPEYVELIERGIKRAREVLSGGEYDLVVLDEINVVLHFGLASWEVIEALIDGRAPHVELVMTGRSATPELIEKADLVTEMREVKHYYMQGVDARKGIEN